MRIKQRLVIGYERATALQCFEGTFCHSCCIFVLASRLLFLHSQSSCHLINDLLVYIVESALLCDDTTDLGTTPAKLARSSHHNATFCRYTRRHGLSATIGPNCLR